ncbi:hypothetical protein [uncultured Roseobacter sp.]|uniref:hypothetical protein n=1 Tax=uncultured Roseobacter sp. TaxID=114847 RepID=UPI002635FBEB|nr:hypothetical protein [uncultured Roseobacter sp.]
MNMAADTFNQTGAYECRAVEVLTSQKTGHVIGYCLGGGRPGPNLLVSGFDPLMAELFEKLIEIPTLPWMWGQLYLVSLNALDEEYSGNPQQALEYTFFDDTLFLPPLDAAMDLPAILQDNYRAVLRACAGMGMIAGRGIPSKSW